MDNNQKNISGFALPPAFTADKKIDDVGRAEAGGPVEGRVP
jgi:hypothetical protein